MHQNVTQQKPKLLERMKKAIRALQMSRRTAKAYVAWARRFIYFHGKRHPREMAEPEVNAFLSHLANERHVSASTQNQALCALVFLYKVVLEKPLGEIEGLIRVKRRRKLPVVLTPEEVQRILNELQGTERLFLALLYGTGLRVFEGLRLRVKDIDFGFGQITVRDGKGRKDRITMLPASLREPLERHLARMEQQHRRDVAQEEAGWVHLPYALARKYPNAGREWGWQYAFPAARIHVELETGQKRRHHLHERTVQKAFHRAVRQAKITKHATCHTLRSASA